MDHRWGNRIAIDLPVRVMHPGMSRCEPGRLSNISLGGALISSALDSSVGARLQVSVAIASGTASYDSVIDAYLVRRSDPQIAQAVILMIASRGCWILGSGTVSTRTSPLLCQHSIGYLMGY